MKKNILTNNSLWIFFPCFVFLLCIVLFLCWMVTGRDLMSGKDFYLKNQIVELGNVRQSVVPFNFVFVNGSSLAIKVLGTQATCNCTTVSRSQFEIPPHSSETVKLTIFNSLDEPNDFFQHIVFYYTETSREENTQIKTITGSVKGRFVGEKFDDLILSPPPVSAH